ncbi:transcriptional regulator [Lactococcus petauri]|jgi:Ribbon-helix-helix protein, copG family.
MVAEDKKRVMITLSKDVADKLEDIAKQKGLSKSGLITTWVNEYRKDEIK